MKHARSIVIKTIRWLAIVAAALVGLVAVALIFFSLSPGEKILKGVVESRLSAYLKQPVAIGRLETNLTSRLVLQDIRVVGGLSDSGKTVLAVHDLHVDYRLWPLLHKDLSITDITVDSLEVNLRCDAAGKYDLVILNDTTTSPPDTALSTPSSFTMTLGSVRLGHFAVIYDDAAMPAAADIQSGRFLMTPTGDSGHTFDLEMGPIGAAYDSVSLLVSEFSANGFYSDTILYVDSVRARGEDMNLTASGEMSLADVRTMSGKIDLSGRPDSLLGRIGRRFGLPQVILQGDLTMRADVGGAVDAPEMAVVLDIPGCEISGARLNRGVIAAEWRGDSIRVDSLYLDGFGGTVQGTAEVVFDSFPQTRAELTLADIDIATLWRYFYHESSPYAGRLQGTLSVTGEGRDISGWDVEASLRATRATYKSQPFPDFSAAITFAAGSGRIRIDQDDFTITATGTYDDGRINGYYAIDISRLEPLAEFFDMHELSGSVSASGTIDGTIDNPALTADVEGGGIRYENFPVDSVAGSVMYKDSVLTIEKLNFESGTTAIDPEHPPFFVDSIAGEFSYRGQIRGKLDSLSGGGQARIYHARYKNYAIDSAGVSAQVLGRDVMIDSAWAYRGSDYLYADGRYDIERVAGSLAVALYDLAKSVPQDTSAPTDTTKYAMHSTFGSLRATFDLADTSSMRISAFGDSLDIGRVAAMFADSLGVGGVLSFRTDLSGSLNAPRGSLDIVATRPHYDGYALDSITADVTVDTDVVHIEKFASFGPGRRMTAQGSLSFSRDSTGAPAVTPASRTKGQIRADSIDLTALKPFLTEPASLRGYIGADIAWDGTIEEPHATGTMTLDSCAIILPDGVDSVYNLNLRGSLRDSTLTIDSASGVLLREPFTMHGEITARQLKRFAADIDIVLNRLGTVALSGEIAADSVDLTARIDRLELGLLEPFVPDVDSLSGILVCRIDIWGKPDDFRLFGNISVDDLAVRPSMISTPITNGVIRVSFDKNLVTVDTAYAVFGGGPVAASGSLTQSSGEITDINMKLTADSVKVSEPGEFTADIQTVRLSYSKRNDYYVLDGDVQLGDSRLTKNFPIQSILPWAQSVEQVSTDYPPLLQNTRLNVRVRESQNLWVDNNLARIRLHSELAVIGSVPQPNLSGQITIEEGYLLYLDRKFKVVTGSASFTDPNHLNPDINFQATSTVTTYQALSSTTYTVTITAQGPMDKLRIELTSQPPLDKADILSILTLGATREQLSGGSGGGEGGAQDILTRRAETLASEQVAGYVSGKIGSLLGLEQVTVQGNLFNMQGENAPRITATKMLSKRIKLTYTTTVGYLNEESIQVGYQLSRRFYLQGQTDRAGESSLDLKYRLLFR